MRYQEAGGSGRPARCTAVWRTALAGTFATVALTTVWALTCASAFEAERAATWQQTLQKHFDVVETFDELQDWSANGLMVSDAGDPRSYDPKRLPRTSGGGKSRWGYWASKGPTAVVAAVKGGFRPGEKVTNGRGASLEYRQTYLLDGVTYLRMRQRAAAPAAPFAVGDTLTGESSGASAVITNWPRIIAYHGEANTWGGRGKSLMMNLGDNDNEAGAMSGIGAQRLGIFLGNGANGKSGYKKIHLFMMVKFAPNYFGASGDPMDVDYIQVFKFLSLCSGFTSISRFGDAADAAFVQQNSPQTRIEYGANASIFNVNGGGFSNAGKVFFTEHVTNATAAAESASRRLLGRVVNSSNARNNDPAYPNSGTEINRVAAPGSWFGLEVVSDIGGIGRRDGSTELYIYDQKGKVRGHWQATGLQKLVHFDHLYNKITLGGNRRTGASTSRTDGRYWIDDFIVDADRIGPKYYRLREEAFR